jgi:hypothetical protein
MSANSRTSPRFKKHPAPERYTFSFFYYYLSHKQCIWVQSPNQYTTGLKPKHGRPFKSYLQNIYQFHLHCLSALPPSDPNYCIPLVITKFIEHGMMRYPHHNLARSPHKVSRRSKGTWSQVDVQELQQSASGVVTAAAGAAPPVTDLQIPLTTGSIPDPVESGIGTTAPPSASPVGSQLSPDTPPGTAPAVTPAGVTHPASSPAAPVASQPKATPDLEHQDNSSDVQMLDKESSNAEITGDVARVEASPLLHHPTSLPGETATDVLLTSSLPADTEMGDSPSRHSNPGPANSGTPCLVRRGAIGAWAEAPGPT